MKHILLLAWALFPCALFAQNISFVKVTDSNNPVVTFPNTGTTYKGLAWIDLDHDNFTDLFVSPRFLFRNLGNGNFVQLANLPYKASSELCASGSWGDYDNDGFPDGITSQVQSNLLHNNGDNTFTLKTDELPLLTNDYPAWDCVFADADNNGRLDPLFVHAAGFHTAGPFLSKFFLQDTNGTFGAITGFDFTDEMAPYTVPSWSDYDLDGDVDLFIASGPASMLGPDYCFKNRLKEDGFFSLERLTAPPFDAWQNGQVYNFPDIDNDGRLDICLTNYGGVPCHLFRNTGNGTYASLTTPFTTTGTFLANCWGDFDNDGYEDVLISMDGLTGVKLYRNNGNGTFGNGQTITLTTGMISIAGIATADYDNDGDLDFYTNGSGAARNLVRNNQPNTKHWAQFSLEGVSSNRSAIGAIVQLKASLSADGSNPRWQTRQVSARNSFQSQNDFRQHFGLNNGTVIDSFKVRWPSGLTQVFTNLEVDKIYKLVEDQQIGDISANKEIEAGINLKLGPNPFKDVLLIENQSPDMKIRDLELYDQIGKIQLSILTKGIENQQIKTAHLPAGIYFLKVTFQNGATTIRKLVKV